MTIADQIITIQSELTALKAAVSAIPTTALPATVDLSPVLAAVASVQATAAAIQADLTPTPPPAG